MKMRQLSFFKLDKLKNKTFPAHSFLFALYSILAPLAFNINEIPLIEAVRPLAISLGGTAIILLFFFLLIREWQRAAFLTTLSIFVFLYYGHFFQRNWFTFLAWVFVLSILGSSWVWKKIRKPANLTRLLNISGAVTLAIPILTVSLFLARTPTNVSLTPGLEIQERQDLHLNTGTTPDIYYIVVDGYAGQEVLKTIYQYDNSEFVTRLTRLGFFVGSQSQSNYMQTALSLASTLNMGYLDDLTNQMSSSNSRAPLRTGIHHSLVRALLEEAGYQTIVLASNHIFTDITDADTYLTPYPGAPSHFENFWLANTPYTMIASLFDIQWPIPSYDTHRKFLSYSLEEIPKVAILPGRKFVFVHLLAPHPPFVFDQYGNPFDPTYPYFLADASGYQGTLEEYLTGYTQELEYINIKLESVLVGILQNSPQPPIIILQGDHGPGAYTDWNSAENSCLLERFSILNAYFLPSELPEGLSSSITPVNTFRLIFDQYFGTHLGPLEDKVYFSTRQRPYQFQDVTRQSQEPCDLP